jgi:hypothetical protein
VAHVAIVGPQHIAGGERGGRGRQGRRLRFDDGHRISCGALGLFGAGFAARAVVSNEAGALITRGPAGPVATGSVLLRSVVLRPFDGRAIG